MSNGEIYHFESFRVDPAKRELWCQGKLVPLQPKAFDCLVYLLEHRDRVVGHDELIATVWGKVEIGDSVLGQIISRIRGVLGDNANRQATIRTITRVGYSWVMPVRVLALDPESSAPAEGERAPQESLLALRTPADTEIGEDVVARSPGAAPPRMRRRALAWALGFLVLAVTSFFGLSDVLSTHPAPVADAAADTAVILPVSAPREPAHAWIRLGVMDLIGERLRAAGQTVVPSDNVVALARGLPAEPTRSDVDDLARAATANIVMRATAEPQGSRWRVVLETVHGREHALAAHGDGDTVIDAARIAADRMAILLGFGVVEPDAGTAQSDPLDYVLQQVKAAVLVDRLDEARALLDTTDRGNDPRILYQKGDIELRAGNHARSQQVFQALLDQVPAERDPLLRAQALLGLAYSLVRQIRHPQARPYVDEAIALLEQREPFRNAHEALGSALSARAFLRRLIDDDYAGAEADYSRARMLFENSGDQLALARLDANLSMLLGDANRVAEALSLGRTALDRLALFGDVQSELRLRVAQAELYSDQLETATALAEARQFDRLVAQVDNPALVELARMNQAYMAADAGLLAEAREQIRRLVEQPAAADADSASKGLWPHYMAAWLALDAGDATAASQFARDALDRHADAPTGAPWNLARTWTTLYRAQRALGQAEAAAATLSAAGTWAESRADQPLVVQWITLMRAENAAQGAADEARRLYESAWSRALAGAVPREMLEVAKSYCNFLIDTGQLQDAMRIVGHVSRWAQSNYDAALLQARLHHALGQTSAWRRTLDRARQLAGERALPPEILDSPHTP